MSLSAPVKLAWTLAACMSCNALLSTNIGGVCHAEEAVANSALPPLPKWKIKPQRPAAYAPQVTVFKASRVVTVAPPGAIVNVAANFKATSAAAGDYSLGIFLVDVHSKIVAHVENSLNNNLTILPTTSWSGPVSIATALTVPSLPEGTYYLMLGMYSSRGPIRLSAGPGVLRDPRGRYYIGALIITDSAGEPKLLAPATLDLGGYTRTFNEEFQSLSISDSADYDGSTWYSHNEQCCMTTTDGSATAMAGTKSVPNPFSISAGGGLSIRLERRKNHWTSGVITSVDSKGQGFSQLYGYFEMKAKFPPGLDTWPAFWLLNTASKSANAPAGEIDVVEYIANPGFNRYIASTLHDWSSKKLQPMSHHLVGLPTEGFHTYGLLWTADTMTFYYDGAITFEAPTPAIMHQPYYLIVDLGIGGGWPTNATPSVNDMQVAYIRAYKSAAQITARSHVGATNTRK